jgi:ribosomal protein L40E
MPDFIKDVSSKISKGIKVAKAKTKEFADTIKLKSEMKETEEEIRKNFQRIGEIVFITIASGNINIEEIGKIVNEVENLYRKITDIDQKIQEAELITIKEKYGDDIIICSKCKAVNKNDAKFCVGCGTSLETEKEEVKICPTCQCENPKSASFCRRCGRAI